MDIEQTAQEFRQDFDRLRTEIGRVIVGSESTVDGVLTTLFAGGHCLLEGVPGLGKTLLIRTLSETLSLAFSRIQFTPDLMPADIIGTNMIVEDANGNREFHFRPGGAGQRPWGTIRANSEVRSSGTFGVLQLTLGASSYSWQFVPIAGKSFTDSGTQATHS